MAPLIRLAPALVALNLIVPPGSAQTASERGPASIVILPQRSAWTVRGAARVEIRRVFADVAIVDQLATTTLTVHLVNPGHGPAEAEIVVPLPVKAVIRSFAFQGSGSEPVARILPRDEARRTYERIVAQTRDPAILEFVGYNLARSCVFPVQPGGAQQVRLVYEQLLDVDGIRVDYLLPRSEALDYRVPWDIQVRIRSARGVSTVYCPSHQAEIQRLNSTEVAVRVPEWARSDPGPFHLSFLHDGTQPTASLTAYPDPSIGGGYFLLLMGFPGRVSDGGTSLEREITAVLDRSGSMRGPKIEQARRAVSQILERLDPGDAFNLIVYNEGVDCFAPHPLATAPVFTQLHEYIRRITAQGGTNIYDALVEALRAPSTPGMLPLVLFLTDGTPTVGRTSEKEIRSLAAKGNLHGRRIFTVGIGTGVNVPLLDAVAAASRGAATYVSEGEDLTDKIAQLLRRLHGPVFADVDLQVARNSINRVRERIPARLPDVFEGDQLVLLGQYVGDEPLHFVVRGNFLGRARTFEYTFSLSGSSTRNAYVPRLWASRKIGELLDAVRDAGAESSAAAPGSELVDEIIRLSLKFGILTEYTAFFAEEGTDLTRREELQNKTKAELAEKAVKMRVGAGAATQSQNIRGMSSQKILNVKNSFVNTQGLQTEVRAVQQLSNAAFYLRHGRWIDSRIVARDPAALRVVRIGSPELIALAERLAAENRQASLALRGTVLIEIDGEVVEIR